MSLRWFPLCFRTFVWSWGPHSSAHPVFTRVVKIWSRSRWLSSSLWVTEISTCLIPVNHTVSPVLEALINPVRLKVTALLGNGVRRLGTPASSRLQLYLIIEGMQERLSRIWSGLLKPFSFPSPLRPSWVSSMMPESPLWWDDEDPHPRGPHCLLHKSAVATAGGGGPGRQWWDSVYGR